MSRDSGNKGPDEATGAYRVSERELERVRHEEGATPPAGSPLALGTDAPALLNDRYELRRELGRGGMGEVYEGWDRHVRRRVAIKRLSEEMAVQRDGRKRFESEVKATARVQHVNVVGITDWGTDGHGRMFYVAEYLEGRDLATIIGDGGALPVERVLQYADQLLAGVAAAHNAELVHRDLKPSNVMVVVQSTGDERVVVVDFGIAKLLGESPQTEARVVMGTKRYVAPEVMSGRPATAQADVYGVGVVLFELLTGQNPFAAAETGTAVHKRQLAADAELRASDLAPSVPGWLDAVVAKAMAFDPAARFASAEAMRQALREGARRHALGGAATGSGAVEVDQLPPGTVVNGYEIEQHLGVGGMGVVYAAVERQTGRRCALKFLWTGEPTESRSRLAERFRKEAKQLGRIDHPRVVKNYTADEWQGNLYLAMEFVPGAKLRDRWTSLGWDGLVRVIDQVADGLDLCHQLGIKHRDVTPENIVVDERGDAKLIDFGIARDAESSMTSSSIFEMIGRYGYISPEQAVRPERVGPLSDQWSLGAIVYEAVSGQRPLAEAGDEDDNYNAYAGRLVNRETVIPPPAPSSPELSQVILKALAYEPSARYPSCRAFAVALARVAAPSPAKDDPSKTTSASLSWTMKARPDRGRRWAWLSALALLVAGGSGAAWYANGGGRAPVEESPVVSASPTLGVAEAVDAAASLPSPADAEVVTASAERPTVAPVTMTLRAKPPRAQAEIDGQRVVLPVVLERPAGTRLEVRVRAPGYDSDTVVLVFDQAGEREVRLKPRKAEASAPAEPVDNGSLFVKPNSGK